MSDYTIETAPVITDGMVHLSYYILDDQLSFVWSGRITEPIHVQHGGYGEATIALINPEPDYPAGEKSPSSSSTGTATCATGGTSAGRASPTSPPPPVTTPASSRSSPASSS